MPNGFALRRRKAYSRRMIHLRSGGWRAGVRPELGGALTHLTRDDRLILRPMPQDAADPLLTACFPLVPFANRIAGGEFEFEGRRVSLPVLDAFAPNALHGQGWLSVWSLQDQAEDAATLALDHEPDAWPWRYRAVQTIALSERGLRIDLSVCNLDDAPMPAGLGLHPCFPKDEQTRLRLDTDAVWLLDDRDIPARVGPPSAVFDWSVNPRVADAPAVDHCYGGWNGEAELSSGEGAVRLDASPNARWVQVHAPPGRPFCCIEPVTHRPDAVHARRSSDSGLVVLEPGRTLSIWMEIGAD